MCDGKKPLDRPLPYLLYVKANMKHLLRKIDSENTDLCHGPRLLCSRMISHNPEIILAL